MTVIILQVPHDEFDALLVRYRGRKAIVLNAKLSDAERNAAKKSLMRIYTQSKIKLELAA